MLNFTSWGHQSLGDWPAPARVSWLAPLKGHLPELMPLAEAEPVMESKTYA